jgi:DNA mismatch repair protein MutH
MLKLSDAQARLKAIAGTSYEIPKTSNKGGVGHHLESLLGVPKTSNCLDFADGELKAFPLKKLRDGRLVPKETVAVTMATGFQDAEFDDHRAGKKLSNTLFVPYYRDGDHVEYKEPIHFTSESVLYGKLKTDYDTIKGEYAAKGKLSSSTGEYLQTRTKGEKGSDTRAFYVRTGFLGELMSDSH